MIREFYELVNKYDGKNINAKPRTFVMFQNAFLRALDAFAARVGGEVVKSSKGHWFVSAFIKRGDKYVYVYYSCVRGVINLSEYVFDMYCRTAKDAKDYCGGNNHFVTLETLAHVVSRLLQLP
jgi:hypothetical protein